MNKTYFIFALISMALLLLWQCTREKIEPLSETVENEISLLPATVTGIGYVNFKSIIDSPFWEIIIQYTDEYTDESPFETDDYKEFVKESGLDVRKDIHEAFLFLEPKDGSDEPAAALILKGNFNPQQIIEHIKVKSEEDQLVEKYFRDYLLYEMQNGEITFCFADENRMVAGKEDLIKKWLINYGKSNNKSSLNPHTAERINNLRYKSGIWFTMHARSFIESMFTENNHHPRMKRLVAFKSIEDINFSADFGKEMRFHGNGEFNDNEKAKLFHDAIKGLIATAKLSVSEDRQAVDVLNKIHTKAHDKTVDVNFTIDKSDFEKLLEKRKKYAIRLNN